MLASPVGDWLATVLAVAGKGDMARLDMEQHCGCSGYYQNLHHVGLASERERLHHPYS